MFFRLGTVEQQLNSPKTCYNTLQDRLGKIINMHCIDYIGLSKYFHECQEIRASLMPVVCILYYLLQYFVIFKLYGSIFRYIISPGYKI